MDVLEQTTVDSHALVPEEALNKALRDRVKAACERTLAVADTRVQEPCRSLIKALDNAVNSRALFGALRSHLVPLKALLPKSEQPLSIYSPYLADFHADLLQVPGQYPHVRRLPALSITYVMCRMLSRRVTSTPWSTSSSRLCATVAEARAVVIAC